MLNAIPIQVTRLAATVPSGVPLEWQGQTYSSGPLVLELDERRTSRGQLDYGSCRAKAEFHVKLRFPQFAETLRAIGVDESFTRPLEAELHSEGAISADHSFGLAGNCEFRQHPLFDETASASILPGT